MNNMKIYNDVYSEYPHNIALNVVSILSIMYSTGYENRWHKTVKKSKKLLTNNIDLELAIAYSYYEYNVAKELCGIGGCEMKSLISIVMKNIVNQNIINPKKQETLK